MWREYFKQIFYGLDIFEASVLIDLDYIEAGTEPEGE